MDNKKSVMGSLHKLEYRPVSSKPVESENPAVVPSAMDATDQKFESRPEQLQNIAPANMPSQNPQARNTGESKPHKLLKDAMLRRIDDYRMTKRDLIARMTVAQSEMSRDIADMKRVLAELESVENRLSVQFDEIKKMPDLQEADAADQTIIGIQAHKLEEMRLDIIRTIARAERPNQQQSTQSVSAQQQINLDSVTTGQIMRYGFGLSLPLIITLILTALLIGFAIIAAFSGTIRW